MKVTVIIPTTEKTKDYLEVCVKSLRETTDWDIVVVSNGTSVPYLLDNKLFRRFHTKDQGQCIAVNIGAQVVNPTTEYIMVSNDDMYYAPGWADKLSFDYPVFSPNLIEPVDNGGSAHPFLKLDGGNDLESFKKDVVDNFVANYQVDIPETTGFNLPFFIRKDVWNTIGGYDTKYDPWGSNSDTDLQTLIELAGIQPIREREALVYHFGSKSGTFEADKQTFWQKNWDYYTAKWGFNRDMEPIPDTWMATNMVNKELNRFHPEWEGKYSE
jgi:glycosyltransferase involved in cell wall biosynthesis